MSTVHVLAVVGLHNPAQKKKGYKTTAHGMSMAVPNSDTALQFHKVDYQCQQMKGTGPSMLPL